MRADNLLSESHEFKRIVHQVHVFTHMYCYISLSWSAVLCTYKTHKHTSTIYILKTYNLTFKCTQISYAINLLKIGLSDCSDKKFAVNIIITVLTEIIYFRYLILLTFPFKPSHTNKLSSLSTPKPKGYFRSQLSIYLRNCPSTSRIWTHWL